MTTPRWRPAHLWARRAAGLAPTLVLALLLTNGSAPVTIRVEALLVLIAAMVRPAIGLMAVAFLAPLGDLIAPIVGAPPVRHAETLVVAFLAGWLSFRMDEDENEDEPAPALPASLADGMWVFSGALIASVITTALRLNRESTAAMTGTLATLAQGYLLTADDPIGVHTAGLLLEGLGLIAAAARIARRDGRDRVRLLRCLVAAGVVGGIASGLLAVGVAPVRTLARHTAFGLARYSAVTGDVNSAASLYLLLIGVSGGVATYVKRIRLAWLLAALIMLAALTLTGSMAAVIASAAVIFAAGTRWIAVSASRRWKIAVAVALILVVGAAIAFAHTARSVSSLEMRGGFTVASMRLIEGQPVFGVGAGRYYPLSKLVLPPWLSLVYARENAHDYYLQIAAELGLVGAIAFVWVLGGALSAQLGRIWRGQAERVLVGCFGGALAYLVTALSGHPFLVPEVAIPFWIVLGLLVAPPAAPPVQSGWRVWTATGFACVLLLTAPFRGGVPVRLPPGDYGLGPWQTDDSGRRFRDAEAVSSLFVGPTITLVEIPMRLRGGGPIDSALVAITVPGFSRADTRVGSDWTTQRVPLPGAEALEPRQRVNLAVTPLGNGTPAGAKLHMDIGQISVAE